MVDMQRLEVISIVFSTLGLTRAYMDTGLPAYMDTHLSKHN